jgi:hypothetical protein
MVLTSRLRKLWRSLGSIYMTVTLLLMLFFIVIFATFAQVDYGIFETNRRYFASWIVFWRNIPIFLGGYSIGLLLCINLVASHATRWRLNKRYLGIFLIHMGIFIVIIGAAGTSFFGKEMQVSLSVNQTANYVEFPSTYELVLIDQGDVTDTIHRFSLDELMRGVTFNQMTLTVNAYYLNAYLNRRGIDSLRYHQLGQYYSLLSLPKTYKMSERNVPGLDLTVAHATDDYRMILWGGSAVYQDINSPNQTYYIKLRPKRQYLPFSLRLNQFEKVDYEKTQKAKHFKSFVTLKTSEGDMDHVIQMNQPLRYGGYTFFQASFTPNLETSVFQVVQNPSWRIPYIASIIMVIGLFIQMIIGMKR